MNRQGAKIAKESNFLFGIGVSAEESGEFVGIACFSPGQEDSKEIDKASVAWQDYGVGKSAVLG
jgi:hypothetical protein